MAFEPGDVVMLKSGGPSMTVVSAAEDEITCLWFGEEGELFREAIPAVALEPIFSTADDAADEDEDDDEEEDEGDEDEKEDDEDDEDTARTKSRR
jgi:uncharacterized protein YodC (DUF2158 family)